MSVTIRGYEPKDFEEVVDMYYKMCLEVYPHRKFKEKLYFYQNVLNWINLNYDIMITEKDSIITGFALCYYDNMGGIVDDYYKFECLYIKNKYRYTRSAYLLIHSAIIYSNMNNMLISCNASDISDCSKISGKLGSKIFTTYERLPQKETK